MPFGGPTGAPMSKKGSKAHAPDELARTELDLLNSGAEGGRSCCLVPCRVRVLCDLPRRDSASMGRPFHCTWDCTRVSNQSGANFQPTCIDVDVSMRMVLMGATRAYFASSPVLGTPTDPRRVSTMGAGKGRFFLLGCSRETRRTFRCPQRGFEGYRRFGKSQLSSSDDWRGCHNCQFSLPRAEGMSSPRSLRPTRSLRSHRVPNRTPFIPRSIPRRSPSLEPQPSPLLDRVDENREPSILPPFSRSRSPRADISIPPLPISISRRDPSVAHSPPHTAACSTSRPFRATKHVDDTRDSRASHATQTVLIGVRNRCRGVPRERRVQETVDARSPRNSVGKHGRREPPKVRGNYSRSA